MTIPARTNRLHKKPYWLGDSFRAINICAARRPGNRFIDINFQVTADGVVACHWGTAAQNGYRFIQVGRKRRAMTREELHRPISRWKTADVLRWRRTLRTGPRYANRVRIHTFYETIVYARRRRVTVCAELKSTQFATNAQIARNMHAQAVKAKAWVYPMTLVTMGGWGQKLKNFHNAGFQVALLAHNRPKPRDFATWSPWINRVWGNWR